MEVLRSEQKNHFPISRYRPLVLKGLVGDDAEQSKLLRFIDLPHNLAARQFAAACLVAPAVADHRSDDDQLVQIRKILVPSKKPGNPLRVLDFGAGKGRLLGGLAEGRANAAAEFDYVAFDPSSEHRDACERQIADVYESVNARWYNDSDHLFANHAEESFEIVVMCNVLHEINPDEWLSVLGKDGLPYKALAENGSLLIVEDFRIPVGELPNPRGFFLLDTLHLQKLFNITEQSDKETIRVQDARGDGRLKAHVIPKRFLSNITPTSRKAAIESLKETSARKLREQRDANDRSYRAGQLSALWSQQFANCSLYLQII